MTYSIQTVSEAVHEQLKNHTVFCSFSGGSDSLALLLLLRQWNREIPFDLRAIHFEHGLRDKESVADAEFCREFCASHAIPIQCIALHVPENKNPGEADEEAARRLRLAIWKGICMGCKNAVIVLGHHADDRIENLFLRLCRGSNTTGATSLREIQIIDNMMFLRPLLRFSKKELESFLLQNGIDRWCHDRTNDDPTCKRNLLRNVILPELYQNVPFAKKGILHSMDALREDADFLENESKRLYAKQDTGRIDFWKDLHSALRIRVLRLFISDALKQDYIPDGNLMQRFEFELNRNHPEPCVIPLKNTENVCIHLQKGILMLKRNEPLPSASKVWDIREKNSIEFGDFLFQAQEIPMEEFQKTEYRKDLAFFDADLLPEHLRIEFWREGDRMRPFGMEIEKSLKKIFCDSHVSSEEKRNWPLLKSGDGTIIWIPGLRHSNVAICRNTTKRVLRIHMEKKYSAF